MEPSGASQSPAPPLRVGFERQYRTAHSEGYHVLVADKRIAHLDLHYTQTNVYATLVLEGRVEEEQVLDLIERIDESIVLSAEVPREDLLVTVYQGARSGLYSDDFLEERRQRRGSGGAAGAAAGEGAPAARTTRQRNVN